MLGQSFRFLQEVVAPTETDNHITWSYIQVTVKAPKTDPYRQGIKVYIGVTKGDLCSMTAVVNFMAVRGQLPGL